MEDKQNQTPPPEEAIKLIQLLKLIIQINHGEQQK